MGARPGELDGWCHCPRCTGPLEREPRSVRCPACRLVVYAKPAPAVCALILDGEGRVLLGRRRDPPGAGLWDLLGGFVEEGEQPLDALRREVHEETGLEVEPVEFVGAVADRYGEGGGYTLNVAWTARVRAGEPVPADDVAELGWFAADELPPSGSFAFRNSVELLELWAGRREK